MASIRRRLTLLVIGVVGAGILAAPGAYASPMVSAAVPVSMGAGAFAALSPTRFVDTRSGIGGAQQAVPAGGSIVVQIEGAHGVPATGVGAVSVNLTVTSTTSSGYITGYPDGAAQPVTSNLDYAGHDTVATAAVIPVGTDGKIRLHNGGAGTVQLIVDVTGYYLAGPSSDAGTFTAVQPARFLDTRIGVGAPAAAVPANGSVAVQILGLHGVPASGVLAVVVTLTATQTKLPGYVTAYPDGSPMPLASNIDFPGVRTVANAAVVPVGGDGKIRLSNMGAGTAQLLVDVEGYLSGDSAVSVASAAVPGTFVPLSTTTRFLDTRKGPGAKQVAAGGFVDVQVAGVHSVPSTGVGSVVVNLTSTKTTSPGYVTAYPTGDVVPLTSNLDFQGGDTIANLAIVPLGSDGKIRLKNSSAKPADLLADVVGYIIASPEAVCGYTPPPDPPTQTPTISSFDFPEGTWGAPFGTGTFQLSDGGATATAGFEYLLVGQDFPAPTTGTCDFGPPNNSHGFFPAANGTATLDASKLGGPLSVGPHTLYIRSYDSAYRMSPTSAAYSFYVSPQFGAGQTRFEGESFNSSITLKPSGLGHYVESLTPAWSGSKQLHVVATAVGQQVTIPFRAAIAGDYVVGVQLTQGNHFGKVQFAIDGVSEPQPFDAYSPTVKTTYVQIAGPHLPAGQHTLRMTLTGTSGTGYVDHHLSPPVNDNGYAIGLDYLIVVPINNVTVASFAAALNNNGISNDGSGTGNIGPSVGFDSLSSQAMLAAGFGPGQKKIVDGVTFTMPAPAANGNDNVIAVGQTFPVPWTPTPINNIDLLVASTCLASGSPSNPGVVVGMNYVNNVPPTDIHYVSPTSNQLPLIPDWAVGNSTPLTPVYIGGRDINNNVTYSTITRAVTMSYINAGTTKDTSHQPSLYHLRLPVYYFNQNLASITLPNIGSDLSQSCKGSIHVFAISHS